MIGSIDEPGKRRAGTLGWSGLPNLFWWIDRSTGLCGAYFSQLMPQCDTKVNEMARLFEEAIYAEYEEFSKSSTSQ